MNKEIQYKLESLEKRIDKTDESSAKLKETVTELKEDLYRRKGSDESMTKGQRTATLTILLFTCLIAILHYFKIP